MVLNRPTAVPPLETFPFANVAFAHWTFFLFKVKVLTHRCADMAILKVKSTHMTSFLSSGGSRPHGSQTLILIYSWFVLDRYRIMFFLPSDLRFSILGQYWHNTDDVDQIGTSLIHMYVYLMCGYVPYYTHTPFMQFVYF